MNSMTIPGLSLYTFFGSLIGLRFSVKKNEFDTNHMFCFFPFFAVFPDAATFGSNYAKQYQYPASTL